ncbi:protoporphyrinogen/coproporphyrinogen oxidase [Microbacterium koreense]|uniref:Protoporphyrinogen/coproporphyrinogen oxidase n=1 Tax=Microbacterium koreense TaxID=323761 RepID=A0ABW2ZN38_9MICO
MTDPAPPVESLAGHARDTHVVIVGGGIAGLVAAWECAKVGLQTTVVEADAEFGGTIRSADIAGFTLDVGADGFATGGGQVEAIIDELGLSAELVDSAELPVWIADAGVVAPAPADSVLGIPANPWDASVRRMIGWRGAWRAYLDRLRPPLTIGQQRNLDALVRGRMGDRVVDRLVAPVTVGRHGLRPDEVDVDLAAPGLNTALTRTGSLGGAVAQVRADREGAPRYRSLVGGMTGLVEGLLERLRVLGADVAGESPVSALTRHGDGRWGVTIGDGEVIADVVIIATPEAEARRLLAPHVPVVEADGGLAPLDTVTLVVNGSLEGREVLPVPGASPARSVTVPSHRWASQAERVGADAVVVRVTLAEPAADDEAAIAAAKDAASALLGQSLDVRGARRATFHPSPPRSATGRMVQSERVRNGVRAVGGLSVIGGWIAGSGLAQIIPDALDAAERVRRHALFGAEAAE